eukprot:GHRQ01001647.1.p1 GENE.GHRQ01001647.1~~GHRQ01001647.1.p1  ORF type:complete len:210 (+),score=80.39 GHRQ01001647.1:172-801(+)
MAELESPRGAVNVGHSPLLQQAPATPAAAADAGQSPRQAELSNARRKFSSTLESDVLDYLHYGPAQLEDCVTTMHTIFNNIVTHPDEPKYRKIKAANKAYLKHVATVHRADDLMLQAGWRPKVVDLEKAWVWEYEPSSHEFRVLVEAVEVLGRAMQTLHAKAERKRKEDEERKSRHAEERERIRLALEDDRLQRQVAQELTAARSHAAQ